MTASQRKRRATTRSSTIRPDSGRSVTVADTGYGRTMETSRHFRMPGP